MREVHAQEGEHELRLDLPAAHSAGRMARQMLRQFADREGVPEGEIQTLEFVAGELLDNAIDHGGGGAAMDESDLERDVRVTLYFGAIDGSWIVRVGDQGGAEPQEVAHFLNPPDGIPDLEDERGRGFFLMAQMVDAMGVRKTGDGLGLEFEASKRYAPAE